MYNCLTMLKLPMCRFDTQSECETAGCCWDISGKFSCFAPIVSGYTFTEDYEDDNVINGTLSLNSVSNMFGMSDFANLTISVTQEAAYRTHIKISPTGVNRWEIPQSLIPRSGDLYNQSADSYAVGRNEVKSYVKESPFGVVVKRVQSGAVPYDDTIFNLTDQLVYQDQYLQFILEDADDVMETFGWGESTRVTQRMLDDSLYAMWASDIGANNFNTSLYGSHPFFMQVSFPAHSTAWFPFY